MLGADSAMGLVNSLSSNVQLQMEAVVELATGMSQLLEEHELGFVRAQTPEHTQDNCISIS